MSIPDGRSSIFFSRVCRGDDGCGQPQTDPACPGGTATKQLSRPSQRQEKTEPDLGMFRSLASRSTVQRSGQLMAAGPRCRRGPAAVKTTSTAGLGKGFKSERINLFFPPVTRDTRQSGARLGKPWPRLSHTACDPSRYAKRTPCGTRRTPRSGGPQKPQAHKQSEALTGGQA